MTTDTAFVPGRTQALVAEDESPAGDAGSRRALLLVGGGALVVVLAIVSWLIFFSGGDKPAPSVSPPSVPTTSAAVPAAPAAPDTATTETKPNARIDHSFRDPFRALIASSSSTPGGVTTAGIIPSSSSPAAAGGATTGAGTSTAGSTTTAGAGTGAEPGGVAPSTTTKLRLLSVSADNASAHVAVDGTSADVKIGEVFAEKFKALRFSEGRCGTFQFGDERFDLCEGETVKMG
jgi:hypothetical protein